MSTSRAANIQSCSSSRGTHRMTTASGRNRQVTASGLCRQVRASARNRQVKASGRSRHVGATGNVKVWVEMQCSTVDGGYSTGPKRGSDDDCRSASQGDL